MQTFWFAPGKVALWVRWLMVLLLAGVAHTQAPPSFSAAQVRNAASLETGPVAPGEILVIGGTDFAAPGVSLPARAAFAKNQLGDTQVLFDGMAAPVLSLRPDQVSVIAPYSIHNRANVEIRVLRGGVSSAPVVVPVAPAAPGVFTVEPAGKGQVAAWHADGSPNSSAHAVAAGEVLTFYITGEGQTDPPGEDGRVNAEKAPVPLSPVIVEIGGQPMEVLYAGGVPGYVAGLAQVNIRISPTVPRGAAVPLAVEIHGRRSQDGVTVAIR